MSYAADKQTDIQTHRQTDKQTDGLENLPTPIDIFGVGDNLKLRHLYNTVYYCMTARGWISSIQHKKHCTVDTRQNYETVTSDIPVTETQTDTEMIDISKTHTETNTE